MNELVPVITTEEKQKPRVLIIGAGFAGLAAAKKLANKDVEVALVDKHNHHLFQPLLYQVATATLTAAEIAAPIRHIMRRAKNVSVYMNQINDINTLQKIAFSRSGREFPYDYLILATGARHSYFGRDEWAALAPGLKSIEDAREIRQRVLTAFEKAEMASTLEMRHAFMNFVIVGAGPTGVELAGAIAELANHTLNDDFRHITPKEARIILVDAGPRILAGFHESLSAKAMEHLRTLGVEVVLNAMVKNITEDSVTFGDETIKTRTVIWAAGVQASKAGEWTGAQTDRIGRAIVDQNLCLPEKNEIYVLGDTCTFTPEGAERPLPGIAPVAKQMGEYAAQDILSRLQNTSRKPFKYKDYGTMATIGKNRAIADLRGFRVSGFIGWLLWCFAHIYFLIGFRNRLVVTFQWLASYLTHGRGVRLIIGGGKISDLPHRTPEDDYEV